MVSVVSVTSVTQHYERQLHSDADIHVVHDTDNNLYFSFHTTQHTLTSVPSSCVYYFDEALCCISYVSYTAL